MTFPRSLLFQTSAVRSLHHGTRLDEILIDFPKAEKKKVLEAEKEKILNLIQENQLGSDELLKIAFVYAENYEEGIDDPTFLQ